MISDDNKKIAEALTDFFIVKKNIDRFVLTREQEKYLLNLAKTGNKKAIREIIEAYEWLVEKIASIYYECNQDIQFKTLLEKGFSALQKAIVQFELQKNYRFSTYVFWWIVSALGVNTDLINLETMKNDN